MHDRGDVVQRQYVAIADHRKACRLFNPGDEIPVRFAVVKLTPCTPMNGDHFDTGIFRYATIDAEGSEQADYIHFQNLGVFRDGRWLTLMERQVEPATEAQWNNLPVWD